MSEYCNGWIYLHKKILNWEWYQNINVKTVFLHLLLTANWENKRWQGINIERGKLLTSVNKLSVALNLSNGKIRKALNQLKSTNEIAIKTTNNYTIITVINYDSYQIQENANSKLNDKPNDKQSANEVQTDYKQSATTKEGNKDKEDNKVFVKPTIKEISDYIILKKYNIDPDYFYEYYETNNWQIKGREMISWKLTLSTWNQHEKKNGKPKPEPEPEIRIINNAHLFGD